MKALQWDGLGTLESAPDADEPGRGKVRLRVLETLFETGPSPKTLACRAVVESAGPDVPFTAGASVLARCSRAASVVTLDAALCWGPLGEGPQHVPADAFARIGGNECLVPLLAEILGAIDKAGPDLGWSALVVGSSLRSELLLLLARHAGARHLASLRAPGEPEPAAESVKLFQGDPASTHPALASHLREVSGPVVAFCDASDTRAVLAILAALPPRSALVLLEGSTSDGDAAAVNFCDDVHRKNLWVHGCGPGLVERSHVLRASALLRHGRLSLDRLGIKRVESKEGARPDSEGRWLILDWPAE